MLPESHPSAGDHRIDEELVCVDSLKHVLCARCGCKHVDIQREQHDPPDFTVTIDGEAFPTEVRSVVSGQHYHAQCDEFAQVIWDSAKGLGLLSGKYAFAVSRMPRIPKPTSRQGRKLLEDALAYIDATKQEAESAEVLLLNDQGGKISIVKLSPTGSAVGLVQMVPALWENEVRDELAALIQQCVDTKRRKLGKAGVSPGRALLLLYDAFCYAAPQTAIAALEKVEGYNWFHSVFWAASFLSRTNATYPTEPGRKGLFLFSTKREWNGVGTVALEWD